MITLEKLIPSRRKREDLWIWLIKRGTSALIGVMFIGALVYSSQYIQICGSVMSHIVLSVASFGVGRYSIKKGCDDAQPPTER